MDLIANCISQFVIFISHCTVSTLCWNIDENSIRNYNTHNYASQFTISVNFKKQIYQGLKLS